LLTTFSTATLSTARPKLLHLTKLMVAKSLRADGTLTVSEVAEQVGVAPSTVYRALPGGRSSVTA